MTVGGSSVADGPPEGRMAARLTVPEKPFKLCRVRVSVEEESWLMLSEVWPGVRVKSAPT